MYILNNGGNIQRNIEFIPEKQIVGKGKDGSLHKDDP